MFSRIGIHFLIILTLVLGCTEPEDLDSASEYSCDTAKGLWTVKSISCDSQVIDSENLSYFLFGEDQVYQTVGTTSCARTYDWSYVLGADEPSFDFIGQGKWACTSNGETVSSCSSETQSCNDQISLVGNKNKFTQCVITSKGMSFTRVVSAVNGPAELSSCEDGQEEVVTLVQASEIDLDPDLEIDPDTSLPVLRIAAPNPIDFGTLFVDNNRSITFTMTNRGNALATGISVRSINTPFSFLGGNYPGDGGTCAGDLEVEQSCTLVLNFLPRKEQRYTDNLQLIYGGGVQSQQLSHGLMGTGSRNLGLLNISGGLAYDFGTTKVGVKQTHVFTLTNAGGGVVSEISGIDLTQPFSYTDGKFPGSAGTCGESLAAGETCDIDVGFDPSGEGSFNGVIEVHYSDGFFPQISTQNVFGVGSL